MTSTLEKALEQLNPQQKAAVFHRGSPCLVKALAGSGKTKVLTCRAAKLVAVDGVPLERILMVTFTKKAAAEMRERLSRLLEITDPKELTLDIGTFHHVAARLLRSYATDVGIEPNYTILDESEARYAAKACFKQKGLKKDEEGGSGPLSSPAAFLEAHSKAVNQNEDPLIAVPEAAEATCGDPQLAEELVLLFRDYKRQHNVVDYDDLLDYWRCLIQNPRTAGDLKTKWDQVLVDEYQDTNLLQEEILRGLNTDELCVVGDAQQSIYGWRSAEPRNFNEFAQRYANAAEYPLEINYRSTGHILTVANNILEAVQEKNRLKAVKASGTSPYFLGFNDEWQEAEGIIKDIRNSISHGLNPRQICVLTRTGRATLALEYKLNEMGIRYEKRGGIRITDRKEIKHCGAIARLMLNPKDLLAWQTALQLYPRIGAAKARDITGAWLELVERYPEPADRLTAQQLQDICAEYDKTGEGVSNLLRLAADYHADKDAKLPTYLERLHQEWLRIAPDNYESHNIDERKEVIAKAMENWRTAQDLNRIIEGMALSSAEEEERLQEELNGGKQRIVISTIHSAKGLEWSKVILMGAGAKQMPSPQAGDDPAQLAEEQRLVYVALTRAESELTVTYARHIGGRNCPPIDQGPSRLVWANFAEIGVPQYQQYNRHLVAA